MSGHQTISYAQRFEDMHLLRAFGEQGSGFYIDVGAGHPVYDNVSFAFYLRGWRGITVEPNPWLGQLSAAVRPLDIGIQSLVGEKSGTATYYLVEDFHGLSTTSEGHARAAQRTFGKDSRPMSMPVTTLQALCEHYAADTIDFLKIDVEGAEREVLLGSDWRRFRPKVVVIEALAPVSMAPAWAAWEPLLLGSGYRYGLFDSLNRYYVAEEHAALVARLASAPAAFSGVTPFRQFRPAFEDTAHPDHRLAVLLGTTDAVRLPLMSFDTMAARLIDGLDPDQPVQASEIADAHLRLFDIPATRGWAGSLDLPTGATIRDLYRSAVASAPFRAACGRISASTAW